MPYTTLFRSVAKPWGGRRRETVVEGRGSATSPVVGASRRHFPIAARQGGSPPNSRLRPHVDAAYPSRSTSQYSQSLQLVFQSEERRLGEGCVRQCRSRWSTETAKNNNWISAVTHS